MYYWMFLSWVKDQEEKHKFAEDYSIFIGSFANPSMANNIINGHKIKAETDNFDDKIQQTEDLLLQHLSEDKISRKKRKKFKRSQG